MADLRQMGLVVALLAIGCGQTPSSGGGGGGDTGTGPVVLPSGFFQNGASMVTISLTGSPTLDGLQVRISPSGLAYITQPNTGTVRSGVLPAEMTDRFFADLVAAMPIDQHLPGTCDMGTVWGATPILISLGGAPSANLLCPGDSRTRALHDDVLTVLSELNVQPTPLTSPGPLATPVGASATAPASPTASASLSATPLLGASGTASGTASATASNAESPTLPPVAMPTGVPGVMAGEGSKLTPFLNNGASPAASPYKNPYFI
ncbi:MAG TPA: hypothetical protein V6D47_17100 [Oscillatoriaceae cyanobacterium]